MYILYKLNKSDMITYFICRNDHLLHMNELFKLITNFCKLFNYEFLNSNFKK